MKHVKRTFIALAFMGGIASAFAFSSAPEQRASVPAGKKVVRHFFSPSGAYLGYKDDAVQQAECGTPVSPCALGYSNITGTPGNEQPVGSPAITIRGNQ